MTLASAPPSLGNCMTNKKSGILALVVVAAVIVAVWCWTRPSSTSRQTTSRQQPISPAEAAPPETRPMTNPPPQKMPKSTIRHRVSDLGTNEYTQFREAFQRRYRPAIEKWCNAYAGHVPLTADAVTPEKFVERIGKDSSYGEYVFVVDGITLGVRDNRGKVGVDYLNVPEQTRKAATLPKTGQAPDLTVPVTKDEVLRMIEAEGGGRFAPHEVRMTPSALSGSLNGGVLVDVGGNPENGASWNYDMIFGPDGKLAYYLRGID